MRFNRKVVVGGLNKIGSSYPSNFVCHLTLVGWCKQMFDHRIGKDQIYRLIGPSAQVGGIAGDRAKGDRVIDPGLFQVQQDNSDIPFSKPHLLPILFGATDIQNGQRAGQVFDKR